MKIAIIGGGASGLIAAITAAKNGADVTVFERNDRVGKKLLSTGNGRCNITNDEVLAENENGALSHYFGEDTEFAKPALKAFDNEALLGFFGSLGVLFRNEGGKYYPYSETASTVLYILRGYADRCGVKTVCGSMITSAVKKNGGFIVADTFFDRIIIACGGKSSPHLGADGSGYDLARSFGHKISPLTPAITQIKANSDIPRRLKGIKCDARLTAIKHGKAVRSESGQLLFTDYGLSGPPAFSLSVCADEQTIIELDLCSDHSFGELTDNIKKIINNPYKPDLQAGELLMPMLNRRVGQEIVRYAKIPLSMPTRDLNDRQIKAVANAMKKLCMPCGGVKGFQNAQVTLGGVKTREIDSKTMGSKLCKGLYICGEALDITGDCGGYNLQWAFSSGVAAGKAAAEC